MKHLVLLIAIFLTMLGTSMTSFAVSEENPYIPTDPTDPTAPTDPTDPTDPPPDCTCTFDDETDLHCEGNTKIWIDNNYFKYVYNITMIGRDKITRSGCELHEPSIHYKSHSPHYRAYTNKASNNVILGKIELYCAKCNIFSSDQVPYVVQPPVIEPDPEPENPEPGSPPPTNPPNPCSHNNRIHSCNYYHMNADYVHEFNDLLNNIADFLVSCPVGYDVCSIVCMSCSKTLSSHVHDNDEMTYFICPRCSEDASRFFTQDKREFHIRAACPCCVSWENNCTLNGIQRPVNEFDSKLISVKVKDARLLRLFIDSDNNNGYDMPDMSGIEESIKNAPQKPGKIIGVNNLDSDYDGVPDMFSAYNGSLSAVGIGAKFVPLIIKLGDDVDPYTAILRFTYSTATPYQVRRSGIGNFFNQYLYNFTITNPGYLRIWNRNGNRLRRPVAVPGGNYIPVSLNIPYREIKNLDKTPEAERRQAIIYVEAIRACNTIGGVTIKAELKSTANNMPSLNLTAKAGVPRSIILEAYST